MSPPSSWAWDVVQLVIDYSPVSVLHQKDFMTFLIFKKILYGTVISYLFPIDANLLASLALMQFSYSSIKQDILLMQQLSRAQPLNTLFQSAKRFYDALEMSPVMKDGHVKTLKSKGGFSVSFRYKSRRVVLLIVFTNVHFPL